MITTLGASFIALAWGAAAIFEQHVARSTPQFGTVLVTRAVVTLASAIPMAIIVALLFRHQLLSNQPASWGWSIASQVCTVAGAATNLWLLRRYEVSTIIVISGLYPIAAALLSVALGNERLTMIQYIGLLFLAAGLSLFLAGRRSL